MSETLYSQNDEDDFDPNLEKFRKRFTEEDYAKKIESSIKEFEGKIREFVSLFCWAAITKSGISNKDVTIIEEILEDSLMEKIKAFFSEDSIKKIEKDFAYDEFIKRKTQESDERYKDMVFED